jgi:hypothetical protein
MRPPDLCWEVTLGGAGVFGACYRQGTPSQPRVP